MTSKCENDCGGYAGKGYSLCQMCRVEEYHDQSGGQDQDDGAKPDAKAYECTKCGTEYEGQLSDDCPDCGSRRCRYVGPIGDGGRRVATDGSGFTMVDRDGNELEPSDKYAGEHRDTGYKRQGRQRIRGNQMPSNTKWPDIRRAIIDDERAVVKASTLAKLADCDSGTVRNWLDKCEAKGFAECVAESKPGTSPKYRVDEPDELPEVLHLQ